MKRLVLLFNILLLVVLPGISNAQNALELEWIKPMTGTAHIGIQSLTLTQGQFLMPGYIFSADNSFGCTICGAHGNALLLVTDTNGNQIFSHCYGGNAADQFYKADIGINGNIWAVGSFNAADGDFPNSTGKVLGVVKFDSSYNPIWYKFYGSHGENDFGDFITTSDGGALILASTNDTSGDILHLYGNNPFNFDPYLCKLDSSGNIQWLLILGGSGNQYAMKVKELERDKYSLLIYTNSVDYMLTGLNFDSVNYSPWVLQIDSGGHILTSKVAQNLGSFQSQDFIPEKSGGILFGGSAMPQNDSDICFPGLGESDFALMTVDSNYDHQLCKFMGGSNNDDFSYMAAINDSVIVLCGTSSSTDGGLIRCSDFGESVHHGWLGLVNTNTEELVWQTSFCCSINVEMIGLSYDSLSQSLYLLMDGGIDGDFASAAIPGTTSNTYLFKYKLTTATGIEELNRANAALSLFPNPATNECMLKIEDSYQMNSAAVFDAVGREVMPLFSNQQLSSFNINCSSFSTGLYFVKVIDSNGNTGVVKMVKE